MSFSVAVFTLPLPYDVQDPAYIVLTRRKKQALLIQIYCQSKGFGAVVRDVRLFKKREIQRELPPGFWARVEDPLVPFCFAYTDPGVRWFGRIWDTRLSVCQLTINSLAQGGAYR